MPIFELARVTDTVRATPQECFQIAVELETYPSWVSDITAVRVISRDSEGRPTEAEFRAEAMGRRTRYVLRYDYDASPGQFRWTQVEGDLTKRLDGMYLFAESTDEPGCTAVTYELDLELAVPLPGFIKRRAETKILQSALTDFRELVERRTAAT